MPKKVYLWVFPGMGKTSLNSSQSVLDADCRLFQYHVPDYYKDKLHRPKGWEGVTPQPDYPQNYLEYVKNANAEIVLLNCHISLLKNFDQEQVLLAYPSPVLKDVYLKRYVERGDNPSFIQHMEESFEDMVSAVERAPFLKYQVKNPYLYLQDLLDGGVLMSQLVTKKELTELLRESIELGVYTPEEGYTQKTPAELSQLMFDGEVTLDLDSLRGALSARKKELEKDRLMSERRGGLSHEALRDKIMQGIVNGSIYITHGEVSPYSYGFELKFNGSEGGKSDHFYYTNRWECYCPFSEVAERVTCMIENGKQDKQVFSSNNLQPLDIQKLLSVIDEKENNKLTTFTEESKTKLERRGRYTGDVASLKDVHNGIALDGIIQGHFSGDYSSMTTNSENEMLKTLVAMKGFCLDCLPYLDSDNRTFAVDYLKAHGIDVSTPEKLRAWIDANPEKCGLQVNRQRKPSLESRMSEADMRCSAQASAGNLSFQEPDR